MANGKPATHIACPKCNWQPAGNEQWQCTCGYIWHTFATGGQCPGCSHQWETTQCLACFCTSEHSAWYTRSYWPYTVSPN
ncbi:hypothetical protein SAMN06269173_103363 [Hymenobacter mucosus]|uniref:Uncharacterized protein n=1 Tax=Hymenobacter mucosus TaxID=1411120 RepID=A0A238X126_9BACT|nr:hypothetical protein SAMN06269173_103363 [Hymenobacter mucosus]